MSFCRHHFFITRGYTDWMLCMRYGKINVALVSSKSRYRLSKIRKELQDLWEVNNK